MKNNLGVRISLVNTPKVKQGHVIILLPKKDKIERMLLDAAFDLLDKRLHKNSKV